jgi:hypothetical protein
VTTTGHGRRTPAKHQFLDRIAGRFVGCLPYVAPKLGQPLGGVHLYDLTAGDGVAYHDEGDWDHACSPGILARHGLHDAYPMPITITLFERAVATYDLLLDNLQAELPKLGYAEAGLGHWIARDGRTRLSAIHGDGREAEFKLGWGDWAFVNNDPNKIHEFALNSQQLQRATERGANALSFTTMGCNPGGLKRLPFEGGRDTWYQHVNGVMSTLGRTQDLLVMAIDRDDAQWGYLAVSARKWWEKDLAMAEKIFGKHGMTVRSAWLRQDPMAFAAIIDRLFLTGRELGEVS